MVVALLTAITMVAFAANSLLCRAALAGDEIDPVGFTAIRIASGALALGMILTLRRRPADPAAPPADRRGIPVAKSLALMAYALPFSLAYVAIDAGTGALLLFAAVQTTMIGGGLIRGERPSPLQWVGSAMAIGGLIYFLLPGASAPEPVGAALMLLAGVAWGVYSLLGRGVADPLRSTQRNFLWAVPLAIIALLAMWPSFHASPAGWVLAASSGAIASGGGYALWYAVLRSLRATSAAVVQLSVPVIAAAGGALLLAEPVSARLLVASVIILGGIALAVATRSPKPTSTRSP